MPPEARVTSVDALDDFRARLIVFAEKASVAVDDALDDVSRTRSWLEGEQRQHWENQLRRRSRDLETAEQELFSARVSNLRDATRNQQPAVRKARLAVEEAQQKLAVLKKWNRHYDGEIAPLAAQLEKLRALLSADLRQAASLLGRSVEVLAAYAERSDPLLPVPAQPALVEPTSGMPVNSPGPAAKAEDRA